MIIAMNTRAKTAFIIFWTIGGQTNQKLAFIANRGIFSFQTLLEEFVQ
jgi:hypothetical protein